MIERITHEIKHCLECDYHLAALALALTLPDVCGKAEYPDEDSSKKRYINWYNEYIGQILREMSRSEKKGLADLPYLSGELVYQLRCSFLHSGDTDIDISRINEEPNQITEFNLLLCANDSVWDVSTASDLQYGQDGDVIYRRFDVNVTDICRVLSGVALRFFERNKGKFNFFSYNIIDRTTAEYSKDEQLE